MLDRLFIVDDAGDLQFIRPPDHFWDERAPLLVSRLGGCGKCNCNSKSGDYHANIILIRSLVLLIRSSVSLGQTATSDQDYDSLETTIVASACQLNNNNGTSLRQLGVLCAPWGYEMPNNANRPNRFGQSPDTHREKF